MSLVQTTPVPNRLFDLILPHLKEVELKVLLVIIRKTLGWIEAKNHRQRRQIERISILSLEMNTGCSRRGISAAIQSLSEQGLIEVFDGNGNRLKGPDDRKGQYYLCFKAVLDGEILLSTVKNLPKARENFNTNPAQNLPTTNKERTLKKENQIESQNTTLALSPFHISSPIRKSYGV